MVGNNTKGAFVDQEIRKIVIFIEQNKTKKHMHPIAMLP